MNETGITNVLAGMINRANKNDAINKPRFIDNMLTIVSENMNNGETDAVLCPKIGRSLLYEYGHMTLCSLFKSVFSDN